jgi:ferritin
MGISKKLKEAVDEQIKNEIYSANLYVSMAIHFDTMSLDGFAKWFYTQAKEEEFHAMKFVRFLLDRGEKPIIKDIPEPKNDFKSAEDVLSYALEHEKKVTKLINDLVDIAEEDNDRASFQFLQWYIDEQVEEEASFGKVLDLVKQAGEEHLFMIQSTIQRSPPPNELGGELLTRGE